MDIFKVMFLGWRACPFKMCFAHGQAYVPRQARDNKKKKLDNKGAALANVLLITTFVMVLTSSVLSMAYNSYRMKLINISSKDNFYTCEAVLEQVRVAFRNEFSAITEEMGEDISVSNLSEAFEDFYADYTLNGDDYKVSTDISVSGTAYAKGNRFYDIEKVAKLLTSITGTDGAALVFGEPEYSLTNENSKPVFTSSIEITVQGYDNITVTLQANSTGTNNFELSSTYATFHDLTVIYQEDSYESQVTTDITVEFPESSVRSSSYSSSSQVGWVELEDRVKTFGEWKNAFESGGYLENDFGINSVPYSNSDVVYINTTDYPANTVTCIIFDMTRYLEYTGSDGWFDGYDECLSTYYQYFPVYPWVQVQNGSGTGGQYAACGDNTSGFDNVEIYVGPDNPGKSDLENDSNWVKYTDVFDSNYFIKTTDTTGSVDKYISKYGDTLTSSNGSLTEQEKIPTVKYRVTLKDGNGNYNSRGWIEVTGGVAGSSSGVIQPSLDDVIIYVDIDETVTNPEYYFSTSDTGSNTTSSKNKGYNGWGYLFIDLRETNYTVGDKLVITLENVNPDNVIENLSISMVAGKNFIYDNSSSYVGGNYYGALTLNDDYTITKYRDYVEIEITMSWDTYPFLRISYYSGGWENTEETVEASIKWSTDRTTTEISGSYADEASIYYEDWRKE